MPRSYRYRAMNAYAAMQNAGGAGSPSYSVDSADFDGSTDFIRWAGSTPFVDGPAFSFAARVRRDADGAAHSIFVSSGDRIRIEVQATNRFLVTAEDSAGAVIFSDNTDNGSFLQADGVTVVFFSIRTTAGSQEVHLYKDDINVEPTGGWVAFSSGNDIELSQNNLTIGGDGSTPGDLFAGCIGPVFATDEFIDWSSQANRDLVRNSDGSLNNPGADGSNWSPTSNAPEIFIEDTYNDSATNDGSGANPSSSLTTPAKCS